MFRVVYDALTHSAPLGALIGSRPHRPITPTSGAWLGSPNPIRSGAPQLHLEFLRPWLCLVPDNSRFWAQNLKFPEVSPKKSQHFSTGNCRKLHKSTHSRGSNPRPRGNIVHNVHEKDEAVAWLLVITAGSFLYVGLMQIFPELKITETRVKAVDGDGTWTVNFWLRFGCANLGLILGWLAMTLIALFEEQIREIVEHD